MVFEILIHVNGKTPIVIVVIQTSNPATHLIALRILVWCSHFKRFCSSRNECFPIVFQFCTSLDFRFPSVGIEYMRISTKQASHLQSRFKGKRIKTILVSNLDVTSLTMIEGVVYVFMLSLSEILLPMIVSHPTIRNMSLESNPSIAERWNPIFGQRQSHLWNRTRIDAKRLRTAT